MYKYSKSDAYLNIHWAKPAAGMLIPLFSIRTRNSLGCGSIMDLKQLVDLVLSMNQEIIQILPLNESIDEMNNGCPYFTVSAFANDPIYIDLTCLQDVAASETGRTLLQEFKQSSLVHSDKVLFAKLKSVRAPILKAAYESFCEKELALSTERAQKFKTYIKQHDKVWLHEYALFRVLQIAFGFDWQQWPEVFKNRDKKELKAFGDSHSTELNYFKYLQWVFYDQYVDAISYAHQKGVSIMGDVPIFVAPQSADVWCHQELFEMSFYSGAPADPFSEEGQLWGHPHFNLQKMKDTNFKWWVRRIQHATVLYDIIRLDHFRGFESAWKVPTLKTALLSFVSNETKEKHNFFNQVNAFFSEENRKKLIKLIKSSEPADLKNRLPEMLMMCSDYWHRRDNMHIVKSYLEEKKEEIRLFIKENKPKCEKDPLTDRFLETFSNSFLAPVIEKFSDEQKEYIHISRVVSASKFILRKSLIWRIVRLFEQSLNLDQLAESFLDTIPDRYNMAYQLISRFVNADQSVDLAPLYGEWGEGLQDGLLQRVLQEIYSDFKFVIAEDLGVITEPVRELKDRIGVMGMKVFLFDDFPETYESLCYATTGTHDTETLIGWWKSQSTKERQTVLDRLFGDEEKCAKNYSHLKIGVLDAILNQLWNSDARIIVIPFQDLYFLDGRTNVPGTSGDHNWSYRMPETVEWYLEDARTVKIAKMIDGSSRQKWKEDQDSIQILETLPFNIRSGKVEQVRSKGEAFEVSVAIFNPKRIKIQVEVWTNAGKANEGWYPILMKELNVLKNGICVYRAVVLPTAMSGEHFEFTIRFKTDRSDYTYATSKFGKNGHFSIRS